MSKLFRAAALTVMFLGISDAFGAEKTVTFAVANMSCKACPVIVKRSLEGVPGVVAVVVSYEQKAAVVTYDDAKTDLPSLEAASANAGYPATPKN